MKQYLELIQDVLANGEAKEDRTGVGTLSVFGRQARYNLEDGFPLVTTKKVFWKGVVAELLWFIKGDTNVKTLQEQGVHIWDDWANDKGELGPVYGHQWRKANTYVGVKETRYGEVKHYDRVPYDQLAEAIHLIKSDPGSRRIIVNSWQVDDINRMALPPCHTMFQLNVRGDKLDLQLYQRSADLGLGVPFNIASYALLLQMIAQVTGKIPGEFIHTFGDLHVYANHVDALKEQLKREPRALPIVRLNPAVTSIDAFTPEDIVLEGYDPHPPIRMEIAV